MQRGTAIMDGFRLMAYQDQEQSFRQHRLLLTSFLQTSNDRHKKVSRAKAGDDYQRLGVNRNRNLYADVLS